MSHENYVIEATRALHFFVINLLAAVAFSVMAAVSVFYLSAVWAIVCAVFATIFMFGASVNMHDFTRNQKRADATRPTHRL